MTHQADTENRTEHRSGPPEVAKRGRGQPKYEIPDDQVAKVIAACRQGASEVSIARALRINYRTWCRVRTEDERIASALSESRKLEEDELVSLLLDKARAGDTTSIIFALKGRHGYRDVGLASGTEPTVNVQVINLPAAQSDMGDYMRTIEGTAR